MPIYRFVFPQRFLLLCSLGYGIAGAPALADKRAIMVNKDSTQVNRYSVMGAGPTADQLDPLALTSAVIIPNEALTLGDALRWLLRDSGYRLASKSVLTKVAQKMLELPLPSIHRQFKAMTLETVITLIVGPTFNIVQDPVHRLIAFERCVRSPTSLPKGESL